MYHIGKVLKVLKGDEKNVIASDNSVQALIEMWDENQLTLLVDQALADKVKDNDIVLVDYRPQFPAHGVVPNQIIVKILRGKEAKDTWQLYKKYFEKRKEEKEKMLTQQEGFNPYAR